MYIPIHIVQMYIICSWKRLHGNLRKRHQDEDVCGSPGSSPQRQALPPGGDWTWGLQSRSLSRFVSAICLLIVFASVDCALGDWGNWSLCSQSCGGGLQGRIKEVLMEPQHGGAACPPIPTETSYCIIKDCPKGRKLEQKIKLINFLQKMNSNLKCSGDPARTKGSQQRMSCQMKHCTIILTN